MAFKSVQSKSVYAIALSAALLAASPAPVAAASFSSYFINIRAIGLTWQSTRIPNVAARQVNRVYNRNPDRAVELVTQMYARNPGATNTMLSSLLAQNPENGSQLVDILHQNNIPVSPT